VPVRVESHRFRPAKIIGKDFQNFETAFFQDACELLAGITVLGKYRFTPFDSTDDLFQVCKQRVGYEPAKGIVAGNGDKQHPFIVQNAPELCQGSLGAVVKMLNHTQGEYCRKGFWPKGYPGDVG